MQNKHSVHCIITPAPRAFIFLKRNIASANEMEVNEIVNSSLMQPWVVSVDPRVRITYKDGNLTEIMAMAFACY